jgi:hypothetical protein
MLERLSPMGLRMATAIRKLFGIALAIGGLGICLWGAYIGSSAPLLDYIGRMASWGNPADDPIVVALKASIEHRYLTCNWLLVFGTTLQIAGATLSAF